MEPAVAKSEMLAFHDASSAAHALAGMHKAQSSPATKHAPHAAPAVSSSTATVSSASVSSTSPRLRASQGPTVAAGSLVPTQWYPGQDLLAQPQQQPPAMHMAGQAAYAGHMLHGTAQAYGHAAGSQHVGTHPGPQQPYHLHQQQLGSAHAAAAAHTSAGYPFAAGYGASALPGGSYHVAVAGEQQLRVHPVAAQPSYVTAQQQQFHQLPGSQLPGQAMPSSAHYQTAYGQYQHPQARMPPTSPYISAATSSATAAAATSSSSSTSLSSTPAPQDRHQASSESTHSSSGRRATALAAQQLIASSLESVSGASPGGATSSSSAKSAAALAATSGQSEILSLLDSRTVDVRVRGIVALAEQEAASRLQQAHPDIDEDEGGSARKRKGTTDRASRRRELNRVNAKKSRLRKKFFIEALILRVAELEKESEKLKESLAEAQAGAAQAAAAGMVTSGSDSTAATLAGATRGDPTSHCSGDGGGQTASERITTVERSTRSALSDSKSTGGASTAGTAERAHKEDERAEEEGGMPAPPAEGEAGSARVPRVIAATSLTPQMRDALVASGPDWDLVRWMDSSNQAFCIADPSSPDMPLAYVSPGFEVLTGYASRDVIGRNCRFLQGPGTDPAARQRMAKALRAGSGCLEVVLNYRRDGAPFWNRVLIAPLRDATGAVRSYVSVQSCVSKPLSALSGLTRPEADGTAAPAPPPSQQAAVAFPILHSHPSSFSAVQPPQVRAFAAADSHPAFAAAAEAHSAAAASASRSHEASNGEADAEDSKAQEEEKKGDSTAPVVSRAAEHGAAISDADAAMLISQISQTEPPAPGVAVKREREGGESSAVEPAGTRARK